jgi:hypothetical protein
MSQRNWKNAWILFDQLKIEHGPLKKLLKEALEEKQAREVPEILSKDDLFKRDKQAVFYRDNVHPACSNWGLVNVEGQEVITMWSNFTFDEATGICGLCYDYEPKGGT